MRSSNKYQEARNKILTRWYRTPQIHSIFPVVSNQCWRCGNAQGDMLCIFWSCPILTHFRYKVNKVTQTFTDFRKSELPASLQWSVYLQWRRSKPPSIKKWFLRVNGINIMEDLTSFMEGTVAQVTQCVGKTVCSK